MLRELNNYEISEIKIQAKEKLGLYRKTNDIIGTQIFSILELNSRVIYYPLGESAPWGFTRISGSQNDVELTKPFVTINSSLTVDCQVFAAAHELYHIWFDSSPDMLPADLLDEEDKSIIEKKANRFAAEFLMDEILLRQQIELFGIDGLDIRSGMQLANVFTVPFQAMVKRLGEIGFISKSSAKDMINHRDSTIARLRLIYGLFEMKADEKIVMDNLVELALRAYEEELITFEKLEYLLDLSGLTPEDLGVTVKEKRKYPSDEELEEVMEE